MKVSLNIDFWDETKPSEWRKRQERILYLFGVFGVIIVFVGQHFLTLIILGLLLFLISLSGVASKIQWDKKQSKIKKQLEQAMQHG